MVISISFQEVAQEILPRWDSSHLLIHHCPLHMLQLSWALPSASYFCALCIFLFLPGLYFSYKVLLVITFLTFKTQLKCILLYKILPNCIPPHSSLSKTSVTHHDFFLWGCVYVCAIFYYCFYGAFLQELITRFSPLLRQKPWFIYFYMKFSC